MPGDAADDRPSARRVGVDRMDAAPPAERDLAVAAGMRGLAGTRRERCGHDGHEDDVDDHDAHQSGHANSSGTPRPSPGPVFGAPILTKIASSSPMTRSARGVSGGTR